MSCIKKTVGDGAKINLMNSKHFRRIYPRYLIETKVLGTIESGGCRVIGDLYDISASGVALTAQSDSGPLPTKPSQFPTDIFEFFLDGTLHQMEGRLVRVDTQRGLCCFSFNDHLSDALLTSITKGLSNGFFVRGNTLHVTGRICIRSDVQIRRLCQEHHLRLDLANVKEVDQKMLSVILSLAAHVQLQNCTPSMKAALERYGICNCCSSDCRGVALKAKLSAHSKLRHPAEAPRGIPAPCFA
ncbi:PilZ domain-containing protein [Dechloromonas sp. ZS-1]|uniref:PilZ domain-containing protein n=1 Tax=Dechloromonas sp. ZS-1 TaxID=3138067 RepID=UPI0031FC8598